MQSQSESCEDDSGVASVVDWPVLVCEDSSLRTPKELLWPSAEFDLIPSRIRKILRKGIAAFGAVHLSTTTGGPSSEQVPPIRNELKLVHIHLENLLYNCADSSEDSNIDSDVEKAKKQLARIRDSLPSNVVSLHEAVQHYFKQFNGRVKTGRALEGLVALFQWAMEASRTDLVTHVVVGSDRIDRLRLCEVGSCYIGTAFGATENARKLEVLLQREELSSKSVFISKSYLQREGEIASAKQSLKGYRDFLAKCGALRGLSLVMKCRSLQRKETLVVAQEVSGETSIFSLFWHT